VNILLTGAAGQLGSELLPLLSARGSVIATDRDRPRSATTTWVEMDIADGVELESLLARSQPGLIVNTAAYTAVDQAEQDPHTAFAVNAELPGRLASWAKKNNAPLIHYSTDYVFDGKAARPYLESDLPAPQNVYGASKLAGEQAVEASGCEHVILRTSWVYSSHGKNFVLSMLDLARRGISLKVINDQRGCPTWAGSLARASNAVIEEWQSAGIKNRSGLFHYCDDSPVSWYEFARMIFSCALKVGLLETEPELAPVPGSEFPQPAKRPQWSILDTSKIETDFDIHPASCKQSVEAVMNEIATRETV
jgi:dTDP-4-dehydrorhamnose reductase